MARNSTRAVTAPIVAQQLLQTVFSRGSGNVKVSMLYLEAMLFPRIFPVAKEGAPVGAFPMFMLLNPFGRSKIHTGLASVLDHIGPRVKDPCSPTSWTENYQAFLFDIKVNALVNFHPIYFLYLLFFLT